MVNYESIYKNAREKLTIDKRICKENRKLFNDFLDWEEYKLKRINNLSSLDIACFKTLVNYCVYLTNANKFFKNKDWKLLTKKDIKKVYDNLEDGKIKNAKGKPFGDRASYYNKIFRSKPFRMVGKDTIAKEVMEFYKPVENNGIAYIEEEDIKKLILTAIKLEHKLLIQLEWDIGENINSLLQLKKENCIRQINKETKEPEYIINLPKSILKRTRSQRSELTNFKETTEFLDLVLKDKKDNDKLFNFGYRQAQQVLERATRITGIKTRGTIKKTPSWKDIRSSMSCNLLNLGWTIDEINQRLGHKPSSKVIDKYITFLAKKNHKPKIKVYQSNLKQLEEEIENMKQQEKIKDIRFKELENSKKYNLQTFQLVEEKLKYIENLINKKRNRREKNPVSFR